MEREVDARMTADGVPKEVVDAMIAMSLREELEKYNDAVVNIAAWLETANEHMLAQTFLDMALNYSMIPVQKFVHGVLLSAQELDKELNE